MSQKIDWWITSWCHGGGLVTISEMIVSACLHISVIDSPNPKHSPLSTSNDGTLDWNHPGWGGVRAICYLLLARFETAPPPPPPKTPHQRHHLISPHPHYPPPLPEFLPQEHIMVIRRYVCIGINQQKSPSWELWHREVCLQLLINGEHVVVWLDEWGSGTTCRTSKFSKGYAGVFRITVQVVKMPCSGEGCCLQFSKAGFNPFSWQCYVKRHRSDECHLRFFSSALLPPWHCLSPSLSCTCHPSACLIYKVVMAIHSNVISCHINTYISGRYYKACNGGASGVLWGSFFRIFGRMLLVAPREKLTLALILKVQDKRPQWLFYYHQTGFVLQPLRVPFVFGGVLKQKLFFGCIFDPVSEFQLFFFHCSS